eukprot:Plantae.Rhodophyta-Purpureofilum_apyrenoidigerum.ctg10425.p1 GENE.Plantae.Rhodophyta-Purpureofilum_apyrenoidigerum.ctg10425~~Plantae.Rhodophyta-Purpureofilum_apyrenoidigerum.ctg10425.p1  ORF type:complete len:458 (+),score=112.20 Plantae.Rhodophyta-Purpureofilum_apyrenoidigerum.ctg10425:120-1493(+)
MKIKRHVLVKLPHVDFDEHLRVPPSAEFLNTVNELLKKVDEDTISVTLVTYRRITADLTQNVLHAKGHYNIPTTRFTLLRKALAQPGFNDRECLFELVTSNEELDKEDAEAWRAFSVKQVKVNASKAVHLKIANDRWRFPSFSKESFVNHFTSPKKLYLVPGYQSFDAHTCCLDIVRRVKNVFEFLMEDDESVAVFVGGKSGESFISEAMIMCGLLLVSTVPPRKDLPSRIAFIPKGNSDKEKAKICHDFVKSTGNGAEKVYLVIRSELQETVMKEYETFDTFKLKIPAKTAETSEENKSKEVKGDKGQVGTESTTDTTKQTGSAKPPAGATTPTAGAIKSGGQMSESGFFNLMLVSTTKEDNITFLKDYLKYNSDSAAGEGRLKNILEDKDELAERPVESVAGSSTATESERTKSRLGSLKKGKSSKDMSRKKSKSIKRQDNQDAEAAGPVVKASA